MPGPFLLQRLGGPLRRTATQTDLSSSKTKWGLTTGVGTEWAINQNWSIKSEVLYARFEKDEVTFTCTVFRANEQKRFEYYDSVWTTKIGLNYRFGGAPVMRSTEPSSRHYGSTEPRRRCRGFSHCGLLST